jgi:hypothetical protein
MEKKVPDVLRLHEEKIKGAKERLGKSFITLYSSLSMRRSGLLGLVFFGSAVEHVSWENCNFNAILVGSSTPHLKEAEIVIEAAGADFRYTFSEKDFHSTIASSVLSAYAKKILEDPRKPRALETITLFLDFFGRVRITDFSGEDIVFRHDNMEGLIYEIVCFDESTRESIDKLFKKRFKDRKRINSHRNIAAKLVYELKTLTGLADVEYWEFTDKSCCGKCE